MKSPVQELVLSSTLMLGVGRGLCMRPHGEENPTARGTCAGDYSLMGTEHGPSECFMIQWESFLQ